MWVPRWHLYQRDGPLVIWTEWWSQQSQWWLHNNWGISFQKSDSWQCWKSFMMLVVGKQKRWCFSLCCIIFGLSLSYAIFSILFIIRYISRLTIWFDSRSLIYVRLCIQICLISRILTFSSSSMQKTFTDYNRCSLNIRKQFLIASY